ncbi:MAG: signal peptidase I [Bulleidia sp.]
MEKKNDMTETQVMQTLTDPEEENRTYDDEDEYDLYDELNETSVMETLTDPDIEETRKKRNQKKPEKSSAVKEVLSFLKDLAVSMAVILVICNFIVRPVRVYGDSMYPTLLDGGIGFSNVLGMKTGDLERFDIAIIYLPQKSEYLVKRVIGLPGETVSYKNGQLYINGEPIEEDFLDQAYVEECGQYFMSDVAPITLGDDEYYCLGDNRPASSDSRYYGPFKRENIRSKGVLILWPFSDFGLHTW